MPDQSPDLHWRADVPVSIRFGDPYYSLEDGLAETQHVFLAGTGLPERFCPGFHVAELGFGTGLNLLATWAAWRGSNQTGPLHYTSFEAFPLPPGAMIRAQSAFGALSTLAEALASDWHQNPTRITRDDLRFEMIVGDARETLPGWQGTADAWFLDGFAPARNPELWEPALLRAVAQRMAKGAHLATYSAAGHVRRALAEAGLEVTRVPGYGRKRHMTKARKP